MPTPTTWLAFVVATLALLLIPGPSVLYVLARTVEHGRSAGLHAVLGVETGALLHVVAAATGLAALLASSEIAFSILRCTGCGYLLYLGARQLRRVKAYAAIPTPATSGSRRRLILDGMLVDLLNPKTALFFVAFLPQFVDPAQGSAASQIVVLGLSFVALAAFCDAAYAVAAGGLARRIRSSSPAQRRVDKTAGGLYVGLAGLTAFT
ncbi:MAG: LysE family translocator [Geodermatophilaceae bacterium]|nr:LysE family translocator [Geodermatophilaceae bacterium]